MTVNDHLNHFTGTNGYHRFGLSSKVVATDGTIFLAKEAGAYWLLDAISSHITAGDKNVRQLARDGMLFWNCKMNNKGGCVLTARYDSDQPNLVEQKIPYTDLKEKLGADEVDIWSAPQDDLIVLMLKSEY